MGLDTTHNAWHGSYSSFGEWRRTIAEAAGFPPLDEMFGFGGDRQWENLPGDKRLVPLLHHSDCDGELSPEECSEIADALEAVYDKLPDVDWLQRATKRFVQGCRMAYTAREYMEFQ